MTSRQLTLLLTPPLLLFSTAIAFKYSTKIYNAKIGYLIGFLFYWIFWCLLIPLFTVGWPQIKASFQAIPKRFVQLKPKEMVMLLIPLFLGYGYAFPKAIHSANLLIIIISVVLAVANATLEEILWRATFIKSFGKNTFMSVVYPTLGFGIWHYAPQTVFPSSTPGSTVTFIIVATIVGLLYSLIARKYNSIFWTTIAHILFDFSGLGGRLYFN